MPEQILMNRETLTRFLMKRGWLHMAFWLLFAVFYSLGYVGKGYSTLYILENYVGVLFLYVAYIYSNLYLVYGILIKRRYYGVAFILFAALLFACSYINAWIYNITNPDRPPISAMNMIPFYMFLAVYALALKMARGLYLNLVHEIKVKEDLLNQKEYFLRSQIQPHFLFNTLNNFYGLALDKSGQLPSLMLRLSNILRHQIYNSELAYVSLENEITYLKDYIELEKIRYADNLSLRFSFPVGDLSNLFVTPAVMIVFFENAFKHGKSISSQLVEINGHLRVDGGEVDFYLENTFPQRATSGKNEYGGLGLRNVRKRLELLGTENFNLQTGKESNRFFVRLRMKLKSP